MHRAVQTFFLTFAGLAASLPAFSQSGVCDLKGKTINFMKEICVEGGVQNGRCIYSSEKIKILGRTLLYYWDVTQNVGVQYTMGETRDLLEGADEIQRRLLLGNNPTDLNTFMSVKGYASYSGGILKIQQLRYRHTTIERVFKQPLIVFKPGDALGVDDWLTLFAIEPSCSKCAIREFNGETRLLKGGPTLVRLRLAHNSCTID